MLNFLPEWLYKKISSDFVMDYVFEIRVRIGKPIMVNYRGKYQAVLENVNYKNSFITATPDLINYIVTVATKQSRYAFNNQIKHGFITTDYGVRIGLCGTVVMNNEEVSTIKNITSLNIRIAHNIPNCSDRIINLICFNECVKNTLIISPPGAGKTTIVRDIVTKLSNEKYIKNILVVDERFEIAGGMDFEIGNFVDVISGSNKNFAFDECLKTMNPSVIVTDEISRESDIFSIKEAIKSGVRVVATAHAESLNDLKAKKYLSSLLDMGYFERIVVLSKRQGVGTIEGVFDENLRGLYLPYML